MIAVVRAIEKRTAGSSSLRQELEDQRGGRARVLVHDPVAGGGDDGARDVAPDESDLVGLTRTEELLRADRENGHAQLACGEQRLVVDRVLPERAELLERVVHRARPYVQRGVVLAGCFVDGLRIR